jgi:hypothetical protein
MGLPKLNPLRDPAELSLQPLADHPRYKAEAIKLAELRARFAQAEKRKRVGEARARGQQPTTSIADRTKALLAGGRIKSAPPQLEIANSDEEMLILQKAIYAQAEILESVAGELSFEANKQLSPLSDAALLEADALVERLHAVLDIPRVCRGMLIGGGYSLNATAMPYHTFQAAAALGDPKRSDTPAGLFRQWLRAAGITS